MFGYLMMFIIVIWVYDRMAKRESEKMEALFITETTGKVQQRKPSVVRGFFEKYKKIICIIGGSAFLIWGIVSIIIGCHSNNKNLNIQQNGIRTTATIVGRDDASNMINIKGEILQHDYLLEFTVNGNIICGTARVSRTFHVGREVDIYYMPNSVESVYSVVDVAIADIENKPGRNTIWHGLIELFVSLCFVLILRRKN